MFGVLLQQTHFSLTYVWCSASTNSLLSFFFSKLSLGGVRLLGARIPGMRTHTARIPRMLTHRARILRMRARTKLAFSKCELAELRARILGMR